MPSTTETAVDKGSASPAVYEEYSKKHEKLIEWMIGLREKALKGGAKRFFTTDLDDGDWKKYLDRLQELATIEDKLGLKPGECKVIPAFSDRITESLDVKPAAPLSADEIFRD